LCSGIGQKRHLSRILQRHGQPTLVLGAGASLAARLDFSALRDVAAQAPNILVVNFSNVIDAEGADLPTRAEIATATAATWATGTLKAVWSIWSI
jgi:hypothetical protein